MLGGIHFFTGSVVGATFTHKPIISFLLGIFTHHFLDSLPHFDTNLFAEKGKDIRLWPKKAWFLVLFEFFGFLFLVFLFFQHRQDLWLNVLLGGFGGIFPDVFSIFVKLFWPNTQNKIIKNYLQLHLQKFHFHQPIEQNLFSAIFIYYLVFFLDIILILGLLV